MENLIREVIELDKKARADVEHLESEKARIGDFIREEKARLMKQYELESKAKLDFTRHEIDADIEKKRQEVKREFDVMSAQLEQSFAKSKEEWIASIYDFCIQE